MTTSDETRLLGTPEWRGFSDYETRSDGHEFVVRGYASLFRSVYPVNGGPDAGGWNEEVDRGAFDKTLSGNPDVHFLINHEGKSLARTKSGTLTLSTDKTGLVSEARIDRRTRDGQDLEISMERGDLDEMSFAFRTVRQSWSEDRSDRRLLEVNIDKGDVSVVNNGANGATRIRIAGVKDALEALSNVELVEVRGLDDPTAKLREARQHIDALLAEFAPPAATDRMTVRQAMALIEGRA